MAVVLGSLLVGAPGASAAKAPPGDNGDVKIREVDEDGNISTEKHENANDPKVCNFIIEAFNYDPDQVPDSGLDWNIVKGPGFKGDPVESGVIDIDDEGFGRSDPVEGLADGQYKLNVTFKGQKSSDAKHKVFKVDCPDEEESAGGPEPTGDEPAGEEPGGVEPTGEEPAGEEPAGEEPAGEEPGGVEPTGEEPAGEEPAGEEPAGEGPMETTAEEQPQDDKGVAGESAPPGVADVTGDDSGPAATGAVDAGGGGMSGTTALPAVLLGGSLLTLGAVAARRARSRG